MMSTPIYPDQLQGRRVRLLELLPDAGDEDLQCRLVQVSLDEMPPYLALSYVWGTSTDRAPITCNGHILQITVSLAQALRRVKPPHAPSNIETRTAGRQSLKGDAEENAEEEDELLQKALALSLQEHDQTEDQEVTGKAPDHSAASQMVWADAICINQEDVIERNRQVQLMKEIYTKASRVVVWLGPDEEGHAKKAVAAIELITTFVSTYRKIAEDMKRKGITWNNQGVGHFLTFELCEALLHSKEIEDPWPHLQALFNQPYWSRIWCVQEIYLSQDVTLLYGDESFSGSSLSAFSDWYMRESHRRSVGTSGPMTKQQIALEGTGISYAFTSFNHNALNAKDLFLVCDDFRMLQATDARDKVYGVMGLWRPLNGEHPKIGVNYNKSVAEVYADVVVQAIRDRKDLLVLRFVDHDKDYNLEKREDGFPSWVPRWDQGDRWNVQWLDKSTLTSTAYQAEEPDAELARAGILRVKGVLFDRVVSTTNVLETGSRSFMNDPDFRKFFIQLWLEATSEQPNSSFAHQVSVAELATTLTFGFIKISDDLHDRDNKNPDSWLDMGSFDTEAGRAFLSGFQSFMDTDKYPGSAEAFKLLLACANRRLFRTSRGYLGLGRRCMKEGDFVSVLHGGRFPYILRLMGQAPNAYMAFVSDCFVHDIMKREVYEMLEEDGVMTGTFELR